MNEILDENLVENPEEFLSSSITIVKIYKGSAVEELLVPNRTWSYVTWESSGVMLTMFSGTKLLLPWHRIKEIEIRD